MPKKANTPEQIINKLREAEIMLSQGTTVALICKKIGVTDRLTTAGEKNMAVCG